MSAMVMMYMAVGCTCCDVGGGRAKKIGRERWESGRNGMSEVLINIDENTECHN